MKLEKNNFDKGYFSQPTIHKDKLIFVCENDLWIVSIKGGDAQRLTTAKTEINSPIFSPDGNLISFCSKEEGENDVYLMSTKGGPIKRLTWLNTVTNVLGWSMDCKYIFFRSTHESIHANGSDAWLYKINTKGGPFEILPLGPAMSISLQKQNNKLIVLGRNNINNSRWKRYRGGMIGEVWVGNINESNFKRLLKKIDGNPVCPFWFKKRIWFVSDHVGIGNLYSCNANGQYLRQETFQKEYYVRTPATDGETIVYHVGGELWKINPLEKPSPVREKIIKIKFSSNKTKLQRRFFCGEKYWEEKTIHPKGHEIALTVRGKLFSMPLWEEAVRQHGIRDGVRYRLPCWLSSGTIAVISDAYLTYQKKNPPSLIEEYLEIFESAPSETPIFSHKLPPGRIQEMKSSPVHEHIVFTTSRMEMFLMITTLGRLFKLDNSEIREIRDLEFSPDGKWLAYTKYISSELSAIFLIDLNPSKKGNSIKPGLPIKISNPVRYDFSPSFDPEGRWIYFISSRTFNPIWDTIQTGTSFIRSMKPYLLTLKKNVQNPFISKPRPFGDEKNESTTTDTIKSKKKFDQEKTLGNEITVEIDLDGISNRIVEFPVCEGIFEQVMGLSNKVIFCEIPTNRNLESLSIDDNLDNDDGIIWMYDFEKQEIEKLADDASKIVISTSRQNENNIRTMLFSSGRKIRAHEAGIPITDYAKAGDDYTRKSGWIDLNRISISINYQKEWTQMFNEAWRLQKEFFWNEELSGVDWNKIYKRYFRLLPLIGSRSELSDLIWEMQGELATSHAYEYGGDYPYISSYPIGFLGADIVFNKKFKSWFFKKIFLGDMWKPSEHSPLSEPGNLIEEGDKLFSIGGVKLDENNSPGELLVNQANQNVSLKVIKNNDFQSRYVIVKTIQSEKEARYREWVNDNIKTVKKLTNGKTGYIHIPDMDKKGIAEFHRGFLSQVDKEGLIIDVRYNAGGMVSPLILEKLAHRHLGYDVPRWGIPETYPYHTIRGHLVVIANQFTGSDGDMFTESFRQLKLGTIVGKRTWGGVIGIDSRYQLVDGTTTTQPQYSMLFNKSGWSIENKGVSPDIEVEDSPQSYKNKKDLLLMKAIKEILRILKKDPFPYLSFKSSPKKIHRN